MHRQFIRVNGSSTANGSTSGERKRSQENTIRVVSYNVLGDGEKLALSDMHGYCPMELRVWEGEKGRFERLLREIQCYTPDILCLQEVVPKDWASWKAALNKQGYKGAHQKMVDDAAEIPNSMGTATFYRQNKFSGAVFQRRMFSDCVVAGRHTGKLKKRLKSLRDGILLTRLQWGENPVVVANTHLFWDPRYPHVKAAQAEMATLCVAQFLESQNLSLDVTPCILVGDFNTVPHVQLHFLPERQKVSLPPLEELSDAERRSAAYCVLHEGICRRAHPEHPDAFGKARPENAAALEEAGEAKARKRRKGGSSGCGELSSSLGALRNVYQEVGRELQFTTKTDSFCGAIDYVFTTPGTPLVATAVLDFVEVTEAGAFAPIPSSEFASDHLPLGADFQLQLS